jgi:hypothetical protein
MVSLLQSVFGTRRQYAFSSFMGDDSESRGEMRRKAYVSEDVQNAFS